MGKDKGDGVQFFFLNGESFAVNNVVQNVQSAGGVVHPVLAWKQGGCIRVVGTRRIAVSFCIHDMYIWAENAILGDLAGLCFGGRDFGFRPAGRFQRLPASQWDIDEWGQSLQVSGNNTGPLETTTVPPILECVTEDEQIYFECQGLFGETSASDGLHEAAVDFCKVDLCAMTLSGANQVEIDAWKTKMVVMLDNTIEVINNTLPPDHPQTTEAPTTIGYPPTEDPIIEYPDFTTIGYPPTGAPTNCTFDGKMYSNGEKIGISCLVLECVGGTWEPTGSINNTCSMCSIRNDPHFIDFFAWAFDFHGTGSYKIARNVNEIGVTGEFYQCFPFISCLDTITYRDNPGTVITFDRNHVNKISVNGFLFDVTDVVQNVQSAGGVVHPVLAWKHGYNCIRIIGTQGIAVAFCGWEMYVWAQDAILGDLEGLCLADPKFELGDAPRDFTFLPVSQEDIDAWGNQVQEPLTRPVKRSAPVTDVSSTCDDALEEELLQECLDLLGGASYEGHNPRSALLTVAAQFCKVDLCALTQDNATQQAIDEWKDIMVDMMENTVEIIVRTPPKEEPQDHEEESHKGFDIKIQVIQEVNV
nr:uncharacterized protein LOC113826022 [Penaeus vannamei]